MFLILDVIDEVELLAQCIYCQEHFKLGLFPKKMFYLLQ